QKPQAQRILPSWAQSTLQARVLLSFPDNRGRNSTGNSAYTTYTPATAYNFIKPGQDPYIRVFTIPPNQPTPNGLLSADEIIQFVGSRVKCVLSLRCAGRAGDEAKRPEGSWFAGLCTRSKMPGTRCREGPQSSCPSTASPGGAASSNSARHRGYC